MHANRFYRDYAKDGNFLSNVNKGMTSLLKRMHSKAEKDGKVLDLPDRISTNWIRHTFATIARNECGFDRDTVGKCLGHDDGRVTDAYIRPDYSIIDRVCRAVLDKIGIPDLVFWGLKPAKGHWLTREK